MAERMKRICVPEDIRGRAAVTFSFTAITTQDDSLGNPRRYRRSRLLAALEVRMDLHKRTCRDFLWEWRPGHERSCPTGLESFAQYTAGGVAAEVE